MILSHLYLRSRNSLLFPFSFDSAWLECGNCFSFIDDEFRLRPLDLNRLKSEFKAQPAIHIKKNAEHSLHKTLSVH